MKITLKQLKQIIKEEVKNWPEPETWVIGKNTIDHHDSFGEPTPHSGPDFADTVSNPGNFNFDDFDVDNFDDQPLGTGEYDDLEESDVYESRSHKTSKRRRLNERSMQEVSGAMRKTINTCSNHVSDLITFVKVKRTDWADTLEALKNAESALEAAHQSLLNKE